MYRDPKNVKSGRKVLLRCEYSRFSSCVWPPVATTIAGNSRKPMTQPKITRRNWFTSAGLLTSAGMAAAGSAGSKGHPAAEEYPRNLTKEDVDRWMTELSNWGKWGKDDQAGTINLITPAKRRAAAALVKEGVSVSASLDADLPKEGSTGVPLGGGGGPRGGAPGQAGQGAPPASGAQAGGNPPAGAAPEGGGRG